MFTVLLLFSSLAFVSARRPLAPAILEMQLDCAKEVGVPESIVRNLEPIPKDKNCFYKCMSYKTNLLDKDDNFQGDVFVKFMADHGAEKQTIEAAEKCKDIRKGDLCSTAEAIALCMWELDG